MLRIIGAVIAGFATWTFLFLGSNSLISTTSPDSFNPDGSTNSTGILLLILALSIAFSIVSGWLAAKIAPKSALVACVVLGLLLLVVGIGVQSQFWDVMPLWYHLCFLLALVPGVLVGYRAAGGAMTSTAG